MKYSGMQCYNACELPNDSEDISIIHNNIQVKPIWQKIIFTVTEHEQWLYMRSLY